MPPKRDDRSRCCPVGDHHERPWRYSPPAANPARRSGRGGRVRLTSMDPRGTADRSADRRRPEATGVICRGSNRPGSRGRSQAAEGCWKGYLQRLSRSGRNELSAPAVRRSPDAGAHHRGDSHARRPPSLDRTRPAPRSAVPLLMLPGITRLTGSGSEAVAVSGGRARAQRLRPGPAQSVGMCAKPSTLFGELRGQVDAEGRAAAGRRRIDEELTAHRPAELT